MKKANSTEKLIERTLRAEGDRIPSISAEPSTRLLAQLSHSQGFIAGPVAASVVAGATGMKIAGLIALVGMIGAGAYVATRSAAKMDAPQARSGKSTGIAQPALVAPLAAPGTKPTQSRHVASVVQVSAKKPSSQLSAKAMDSMLMDFRETKPTQTMDSARVMIGIRK